MSLPTGLVIFWAALLLDHAEAASPTPFGPGSGPWTVTDPSMVGIEPIHSQTNIFLGKCTD